MDTLRWEYVKDASGSVGQDCGWVDYVQWQPETLSYVYACPEPAEWDPGRRPSSSNNQSSFILHHFPRLYGPGVDEPICMIESAGDYAGTYYYHFDALGSVIALTDADADDVQKYDYSVWGQVGADDVDHPNPYLFTGRRFDTETGLYYYRARYYHPEIGRFLQTDPIGYGDGMNWYAYCGNDPTGCGDPSGMSSGFGFRGWVETCETAGMWPYSTALEFYWTDDSGNSQSKLFSNIKDWVNTMVSEAAIRDGIFGEGFDERGVGSNIAAGDSLTFWSLQALMYLANDSEDGTGICNMIKALDSTKDRSGHYLKINISMGAFDDGHRNRTNTLTWDITRDVFSYEQGPTWLKTHPLATLAHEITHAYDDIVAWHDITRDRDQLTERERSFTEIHAVKMENRIRRALFLASPGCEQLYPRPGWADKYDNPAGSSADEAWAQYDESKVRFQ